MVGLRVWPRVSKKFHVKISSMALGGLIVADKADTTKLVVIAKWKGQKGSLGPFFSSKKATETRPMPLGKDGSVVWDEDVENACTFAFAKEGGFQDWPVFLSIGKMMTAGAMKLKPSIIGGVRIDLAELVSNAEQYDEDQSYPVICKLGGVDIEATLSVTISFVEMRTGGFTFESGVGYQFFGPPMACMGAPMYDSDDDETTAGMMGKKFLKSFSLKNPKKIPLDVDVAGDEGKQSPDLSEGKFSPRSDGSLQDSEQQFDTDSFEESEVEEFVEAEEGVLQKSFSYGTIAGANLVAEEVIPFDRKGSVDPAVSSVVMAVHSTSSTDSFPVSFPKVEAAEEPTPSESDSQSYSLVMKSVALWGRKRKKIWGSPKSARGDPLLNKAYGEEGGDDIDWARRQSNAVSSEGRLHLLKHQRGESLSATTSNVADLLDFGDEMFSVGSWERKDVLSRDGLLKLSTNAFFASFDQRSESAAGESACTALVAVLANWLHTHPGLMPSKTEFDMLIRDGSAEWRKLSEVEAYKGRFPDRHFDLDTVLEAGVRPLAVVHDKSLIGFFQPERTEEFDCLKGAMTFDCMWDEMEKCGPAVYIVSWNDHFFVLRFEEKSCYIIDTLGERLYEGCNQAYILHFDESTTLGNAPVKPSKDSKVSGTPATTAVAEGEKMEKAKAPEAEVAAGLSEAAAEIPAGGVVYRGMGACRQFVKKFLAALQIREAELEAKKAAAGQTTTSIYQKLQIEFHYATAVQTTVA